jgi:zinc protease
MESIRSSLSARLSASLARCLRPAALALGLFAATAAVADVPKVERVVSPGGIEAWLMTYNEAPLITMRLVFSGGTLQEPDDKYGTADMTAYLFNEGAGHYDAPELLRRRNLIGLRFSAAAGAEHFVVSFSTPSKYKDEAFELLRLAMHEPRFDAEPIGRARTAYLASVEASEKDPSTIASAALDLRVLGKHPFTMDWATRKAGLRSIDHSDIVAFRRRILARDSLKVAVAGDIDAATLAPLLDLLFGGLPAKAELRPLPTPTGTPGGCHYIAMDIPQALVKFGVLTGRLTWERRRANQILDAILNGESRLFEEVRAKRGLVYGVGTTYTNYANFGIFEGAFAAAIEEVPEALSVTMRELRRMAAEGPTEEEVATVKRAFLGSYLLGLDTGAALANVMSNAQIAMRPITYLDDFVREMEKVTRQDVWEVAKLLLDPDRFTVIIAGAPTQTKLCDALLPQDK